MYTRFCFLMILFISLISCAFQNAPAMISDYKSPGQPNFYNSVSPDLEGEACYTNILGIYKYGDASIDSAMRAGKINAVRSVDRSDINILSLWTKSCVIVKGTTDNYRRTPVNAADEKWLRDAIKNINDRQSIR